MRTRPVGVTKPYLFPACCVSCGAIEMSGREFFVDLGFDINHLYDAFPDGAVYMCNHCMMEYVRTFMRILEEQERTLEDVSFDGPRTDPVFNKHRELLDDIERRVDQDSSGTLPEQVHFTASFGG